MLLSKIAGDCAGQCSVVTMSSNLGKLLAGCTVCPNMLIFFTPWELPGAGCGSQLNA